MRKHPSARRAAPPPLPAKPLSSKSFAKNGLQTSSRTPGMSAITLQGRHPLGIFAIVGAIFLACFGSAATAFHRALLGLSRHRQFLHVDFPAPCWSVGCPAPQGGCAEVRMSGFGSWMRPSGTGKDKDAIQGSLHCGRKTPPSVEMTCIFGPEVGLLRFEIGLSISSQIEPVKQISTSSRPEPRGFIARRSGETPVFAFVLVVACFSIQVLTVKGSISTSPQQENCSTGYSSKAAPHVSCWSRSALPR
jgi:hypothetical protein